MRKTPNLLLAIALPEFISVVSTPFTIASIDTWYKTLNKPFFTPPNWVFGPVWTILYLLMGISMYVVWMKGIKTKKVRIASACFILQLALNFLWSFIFFGLHQPFLAFFEITALWTAVFFLMVKFYEISKPAGFLLVPYLIWISFAGILNFSIMILNL